MEQPVDKFSETGDEIGEPTAKAEWPSRPQRRLLRRIFNGRTVPISAGGQDFLTYKSALAYLLTLELIEREACYEDIKAQALSQKPSIAD